MLLQKDTLKGGMHVIFAVFTTDFSESIFFHIKIMPNLHLKNENLKGWYMDGKLDYAYDIKI